MAIGEEPDMAPNAMKAVGTACSRNRRMSSPAASVTSFVLPLWR